MSRIPRTRESYALRKFQFQCWARSVLDRQPTKAARLAYLDLVEKHNGPHTRRRLRRYMLVEFRRRQQQ